MPQPTGDWIDSAPLSRFGERVATSYGELAARIRRAVSVTDASAAGLGATSRRDLDLDDILGIGSTTTTGNRDPMHIKVYFGSRQGAIVALQRHRVIVQAPGGKPDEVVDVLVTFSGRSELKHPQRVHVSSLCVADRRTYA